MSMSGRGLLSRIAGNSAGHEVESIVAHLRALLGTRRGDAPSAPSFGVVPLADVAHGLPGAGEALVRSISAAILEYEPRLGNVTVRQLAAEGLFLRFEITGELAGPRGRPVRFAARFKPGGNVEVAT
jgi:type VI secretion system protein